MRGSYRRKLALGGVAISANVFGLVGAIYGIGPRIGQQAVAVHAPDVFGGYASTHIVVRLKPGVLPEKIDQNLWTIDFPQRGKKANRKGKFVGPLPLDPLAASLEQHGVTNIKPVCDIPAANIEVARQIGLDRYYKIEVPAGSDTQLFAAQMAAFDDRIELAELDGIGGIAEIPNDPDFTTQWNMQNLGQSGGLLDADVDAPEAWTIHQGSSSIVLAIIDTGVQDDHPDLIGRVVSGWNTRADTYEEASDTYDPHGHGTHVAGIAAATGNNSTGIAGINWNVTILAMTCASPTGQATETDCGEAIIYATDHGADIASMSLQFYTGTQFLEDAVDYAYNNGVLPIAAAGNSPGFGDLAFPAQFENCLSVASTDHNDNRSSFSNFASGTTVLDVSAPGSSIYSLWKNSGYNTISGTSMATPHVSGLAALLMSYNPKLSIDQVWQTIRNTAEDRGPIGCDDEYGCGRINTLLALQSVTPVPGDGNADGIVDVDDLGIVFTEWGPCPENQVCYGDMNGDQQVDVDDLGIVFINWD